MPIQETNIILSKLLRDNHLRYPVKQVRLPEQVSEELSSLLRNGFNGLQAAKLCYHHQHSLVYVLFC